MKELIICARLSFRANPNMEQQIDMMWSVSICILCCLPVDCSGVEEGNGISRLVHRAVVANIVYERLEDWFPVVTRCTAKKATLKYTYMSILWFKSVSRSRKALIACSVLLLYFYGCSSGNFRKYLFPLGGWVPSMTKSQSRGLQMVNRNGRVLWKYRC